MRKSFSILFFIIIFIYFFFSCLPLELLGRSFFFRKGTVSGFDNKKMFLIEKVKLSCLNVQYS